MHKELFTKVSDWFEDFLEIKYSYLFSKEGKNFEWLGKIEGKKLNPITMC